MQKQAKLKERCEVTGAWQHGSKLPHMATSEGSTLWALIEPSGHFTTIRIIFELYDYNCPSLVYSMALDCLADHLGENEISPEFHELPNKVREAVEHGELPDGWYQAGNYGTFVQLNPGWGVIPITKKTMRENDILIQIEKVD